MQQLKKLDGHRPQESASQGTFVQRLVGWSIQVPNPVPCNADQFEDDQRDLDQRVRESGEW